MSSEEEATAANVLSQMSQMQQVACETIEATVINVGHHCDVETSGAQGDQSADPPQEIYIKVDDPQQDVHAANPAVYSKPAEVMPVAATVADPVAAAIRLPGSGAKIYHCEFCSKVFNKSYNLKTHIRVHTGERPFQCEVCGHGFANLGDLKRHARTHTGEKPFKCEYCSKVFSDFGSHKRHLRLHTGFKPFKCEQCNRQFTRLDSYKNHVRLHTGDRPYKCETCQKEFNYLTTYKRHLNIHKGEKPFSCEQCDKKFTRQNYLKNHMNTHAKLSTQECQTDVSIMVRADSPDEEIDVDAHSGLGPTEDEGAADDLTKDGQSRLENEADKANGAKDGEGEVAAACPKQDSTKSLDASLLHQVTQVLGEIVPQSISAEVLEGSAGPQIVVQGADQTGGEFKITLAQQLLIAQHILEQAQVQRAQSSAGETSEGQITTEISAELADQIVSQASIQHTSRSAEQQPSAVVIHREPGVEGLEVPMATEQQPELVVESEQEVAPSDQLEITQEGSSTILTEHVLEENTAVPIPVTSSGAVYVAIDPTQPDVHQLLGEIHMVSEVENTQEEPTPQS